jgi:diguanylate cyclase (GGDEF)-like protein
MSDQEIAQERIHHQALHDPLTGLANRALIIDRIGQMLARSRRSQTPCAVMFLDLDNFKDINDTLGHQVGDELLVAVGARLAGALRGADTVGRLGGDEFVLLLEGALLSAGLEVIADRILDAFRAPFEIGDGFPLSVSASIGTAPGVDATPGELLRDADIALYRAKAAGKDCAVTFQTSMQAAVDDHRYLDLELHRALAENEFYLLYQPTIDLQTNAFTGVEALLRWRHPDRGVVQPDEFIPALEASGLIVPVGAWVLEEACRQGALWRAGGHTFSVSVNVSVRQLERGRIFDDVQSALALSGFDPALLVLELTERTLMEDVDATIVRLGLLKSLGVRIAIDDFGTGYSSIAYLRRFPIDVLKIDRSFVSGIADSGESAALVHTLVDLGKALKLETVAQGIEDDDQRVRLQAEHVDTGQGFLFSQPIDVAAIDQFLKGLAVIPTLSNKYLVGT